MSSATIRWTLVTRFTDALEMAGDGTLSSFHLGYPPSYCTTYGGTRLSSSGGRFGHLVIVTRIRGWKSVPSLTTSQTGTIDSGPPATDGHITSGIQILLPRMDRWRSEVHNSGTGRRMGQTIHEARWTVWSKRRTGVGLAYKDWYTSTVDRREWLCAEG